MKNNITTAFLVALLALGFSVNTWAQSRIAHINTEQLLSEMPKMKEAQEKLKQQEDNYRKQFEPVYMEFQAKVTELQSLPPTTTQEEFTQKQKEIITLRQNIQDAEKSAGQDLQKKRQELYQPIMDEARNAVIKVARAQGFQYVLDSTPGGNVIIANGKDLLEDVKKELGITPGG